MPEQYHYNKQLDSVRQRIAQACADCGRDPSAVTLLAVSKRHPVEAISGLFRLGVKQFGESYANEGAEKQKILHSLGIEWHFIGPLQSNKTRLVAGHFDWVQSVDRSKLVTRLDNQRPAGLPPLKVLLQVNIDREPQKSGCDPEETETLADQVQASGNLRLRGLMTIPRPGPGCGESFKRMKLLFESLRSRYPDIDTLSMGMSEDLEAAIAAGSTMIRVGTALFGPREQ